MNAEIKSSLCIETKVSALQLFFCKEITADVFYVILNLQKKSKLHKIKKNH